MSSTADIRSLNREPVKTGLDEEARRSIAETLSRVLTSTYLLMAKTHLYHWNVRGPQFHSIHAMTEEQYTDLFEATDTIAERIRALGHPAPMQLESFLKDGIISLGRDLPDAMTMVSTLAADHEALARDIRHAAEFAEEHEDFVTHDMLTARLAAHEKTVWMLKATAGE